MVKKTRQGYWVQGHFVPTGSELDAQLTRQRKGDSEYSRSDAKRDSDALQTLGQDLLTLSRARRDALRLPEPLVNALHEHQRLEAHGALRRQRQYIGKLMRSLDENSVAAIRQALHEQHQGSAAQTLALHQAEGWRDALMASDAALTDWLKTHPDADAQALRSLVRQARKDAQPSAAGQTPRHGRAYRDLFKIVRDTLDTSAKDSTHDA